MKGIHGSLGPTWAKCSFSFSLCQLCGVNFFLPLPSPPFTHTDVLDQPKKYGKIISTYMYTRVLFTTLHYVHVSLMSLTYVPITVQRNYLPYKRQPGNAQFCGPLVVSYFSQSLGAWVPLPNMSTTQSYHSP